MNKVVTLIPFDEIESSALDQLKYIDSLDFVTSISVMPDIHSGYTMPIGTVALMDNVISPECVGYDIGCGMCHVVTDIKAGLIMKDREDIFKEIYSRIPVGFNSRPKGIEYESFSHYNKELKEKVDNKLNVQLGTLGSGNHFIELGRNKDGYLTVTVHSGSRNIGHSIASYYIKLSKTEDTKLPKGFLFLNSKNGQDYLKDMNFSLEYALENRKIMLKEVMDILGLEFNNDYINENHNHAIVQENGMVLHRKGATPADKGQYGVIPGNMRDGVYVTIGLGNEKYLSSASHGAGRKFSRKKAKETIDINDFKESMKGIVAKVDNGTLDESPDAYKNLDYVIGLQKGIVVDIIDKIEPIINIKG